MIALAGCLFTYLLLSATVRWEGRDRSFDFAVSTDSPLNESQVLELSRKALTGAGQNVADFSPERFEGNAFYDSNSLPSFSVEVRWDSTDLSRILSVQLEQHGRKVNCVVRRLATGPANWHVGSLIHVLHGQVCFAAPPPHELGFGLYNTISCFGDSTVIRMGGTYCFIDASWQVLLGCLGIASLAIWLSPRVFFKARSSAKGRSTSS